MYSFLVADDHHSIRINLIAIIRAAFTECIIEEAENETALFKSLEKQKFDILITDIGRPQTDPYRLVEKSLILQPNIKILVLSINEEELHAPGYIKMGALGFLEKNNNIKELTNAIRSVLGGHIYMSPTLLKCFIAGKPLTRNNPFLALSQKESEICLMICKGQRLSEIAKTKQISLSMVSSNKTRILKKLNVANHIDLLNKARLYSYLY